MAEAFVGWVASLPTASIYGVLVVLSAVENVFPPVPADVAVVLGAFLSREGRVSAPLLGFLCWLGNTASSAGMYYFARSHGRRFFETGWPAKLMPPATIAVLERAYARHGVYGIFLSRFLPGIRAAVTPFAGVARMPAARALIPAASASALWYAFLVTTGALLASNWDRAQAILGDANRVLAIVTGALVVLAVSWLARRRARRRPAGQ